MFVDADFAGWYHQEHSTLCDNVLSRTGYVINFCGCPFHWVSKLQSEIALSNTESKYLALSMATRDLLPLRRILEEIHKYSMVQVPLSHEYSTTRMPTLSTTSTYEDNAACTMLANSDSCKQRTKHIAIKWHYFRDQIRLGHIKIVKIDMHHNWADILTKPLGRQKFWISTQTSYGLVNSHNYPYSFFFSFFFFHSMSSYEGALARALAKAKLSKGYELYRHKLEQRKLWFHFRFLNFINYVTA